jgi:hypothetical protein
MTPLSLILETHLIVLLVYDDKIYATFSMAVLTPQMTHCWLGLLWTLYLSHLIYLSFLSYYSYLS